jgi:hypothetical protein
MSMYDNVLDVYMMSEFFDESYERLRPYIPQAYVDEMHGLAAGVLGVGGETIRGIAIGGLGAGGQSLEGLLIGGLGAGGESVRGLAIGGLGVGGEKVRGVALGGLGVGGESFRGLALAGLGVAASTLCHRPAHRCPTLGSVATTCVWLVVVSDPFFPSL